MPGYPIMDRQFRSKDSDAAHPDLAPRYVKGPSKLPDDLKGPTGMDYRARGGKTATEMAVTVTTPKGKAMNVPTLVPGQRGTKQLLKGRRPTSAQVARGIKYAKKAGAPRYGSVDEALSAERRRHERLESEY